MFFLFGLGKNLRNVNSMLIDLILCLARRAIFLRRNLFFYEDKWCDLWGMFKMQYKGFSSVIFSVGFTFFEDIHEWE